MFSNTQHPVGIIARQKLSGLGEHLGVRLPDGSIAHLTLSGERIVSFDEFSQGRPVREVKQAAPEQYRQIAWRANVSASNPGQYRLLDRNCETYATWLMGEKPHSPQVQGVLLIGILAAILRFS